MNCNLIWRTVAVLILTFITYGMSELLECALSQVHQNTNKDGL